MMLILFALAAGAVVDSFKGASRPDEHLRAEIVEIPPNVAPADFAMQIIEREGIVSWNGKEATMTSSPGAELAWKGRVAGNGREITVYHGGSGSTVARHVCVVRRDRGGTTDTHWAALRWCAASFGIQRPEKHQPSLPATPPPG